MVNEWRQVNEGGEVGYNSEGSVGVKIAITRIDRIGPFGQFSMSEIAVIDNYRKREQADWEPHYLRYFHLAVPADKVNQVDPSPMRRVGILIVGAALFAALSTRTSTAQTQGHLERKVVSRIAPFYPEMAKRMHLSGVVKLEVVVRANGTVKSTKALGGSPVLIQSATYAAQKWRFEVAPEETTEAVQIVFELP